MEKFSVVGIRLKSYLRKNGTYRLIPVTYLYITVGKSALKRQFYVKRDEAQNIDFFRHLLMDPGDPVENLAKSVEKLYQICGKSVESLWNF